MHYECRRGHWRSESTCGSPVYWGCRPGGGCQLVAHVGWSLPKKCTLEATGLGGSDLSFQDKADKHRQNIYGPSMTTVEPVAKCHIFGTTSTTALGISKPPHEFLVLHYFATDNIIYWNSFLHEVMPLLPLPVPVVPRAEVVNILQRTHVAPSHRRMPHHT